MLNYEMRVGSLGEDMTALDLFSISKHDYYADATKVEVRNIWTNDIKLYNGENIMIVTNYDGEDLSGNRNPNRFSDEVIVVDCDNSTKTYSFIADKFITLNLTAIETTVVNEVLLLSFQFDSWHYFRTWDNFGITLYISYPTENGDDTIVFEGCQFITPTEIQWIYDATHEKIDDFMCSIFRNDKYELVGVVDENELEDKYVVVDTIPETACYTDELYLAKRKEYRKYPQCVKWQLYEKTCNDGSLLGVTARRNNFKYEDVNMTEEYVVVPTTSIHIPLSLATGNNLYQEQNVNDKFVSEETTASKNKSPEMEKFIYHPVLKTQTGEYHPIHKIKFNLHFRERDENGWIVKNEGYWNGLNENCLFYNNVGQLTDQFFSYADKGRQSDLLCYLGFTDSDVRYQKAKLKQSFLRLSFYDSMNRANQNLLAYSTIFVDSGKLFAKMMQGAGRKGLYVVSGQSDDNGVTIRYDDLKVNREPCFSCLGYHAYSDDDVEEFRLSSQFVVTDRYGSSCSEGFYLYLWADNDNGTVPSDIYMRVDFNHAGYGRIIPLTMPFAFNNGGLKDDFEYVASQWTAPNGGWGILRNEKYSYIHFKYVYDNIAKQHVYYLDPDTYGTDSYAATSEELVLDLYEPKITFEDDEQNG